MFMARKKILLTLNWIILIVLCLFFILNYNINVVKKELGDGKAEIKGMWVSQFVFKWEWCQKRLKPVSKRSLSLGENKKVTEKDAAFMWTLFIHIMQMSMSEICTWSVQSAHEVWFMHCLSTWFNYFKKISHPSFKKSIAAYLCWLGASAATVGITSTWVVVQQDFGIQ